MIIAAENKRTGAVTKKHQKLYSAPRLIAPLSGVKLDLERWDPKDTYHWSQHCLIYARVPGAPGPAEDDPDPQSSRKSPDPKFENKPNPNSTFEN